MARCMSHELLLHGRCMSHDAAAAAVDAADMDNNALP